jgi:hypothetical protein
VLRLILLELDIGGVQEEGLVLQIFKAVTNAVQVLFAEVFEVEAEDLTELFAVGVELEVLDIGAEQRELFPGGFGEGEDQIESNARGVRFEMEEGEMGIAAQGLVESFSRWGHGIRRTELRELG